MSTTRTHKSIAHTAVIATATGVAALGFACPASAERNTLIYQPVISACRGGDDCDLVQVPFTATSGALTVLLSNTPANHTNDCAKAVAEFSLDGQRLQSRLVGPPWEQPPFTVNTAPGQHTLGVQILSQSDCKTGDAGRYASFLTIWEDVQPAAPAQQAPPPPVTDAIGLSFSRPSLNSITATVTNSSALTAKCTYDATAPLIPPTHRDFTVSPNGSTQLSFSGIALGATYHVVVSCHDASGKQTQEIGHAEQDVTF
jgi:hypothetical protein